MLLDHTKFQFLCKQYVINYIIINITHFRSTMYDPQSINKKFIILYLCDIVGIKNFLGLCKFICFRLYISICIPFLI